MGLTIGEKRCINCREYTFTHEDMIGRTVEKSPERGRFRIPVRCDNCKADMSIVFFPRFGNQMGVSYRHTNNDEPCYDENCPQCTGNGKGLWTD